jgi:Na+/alanine symporter
MEALTQIVGDLNSIVWGVPMLILILGAGFTLLLLPLTLQLAALSAQLSGRLLALVLHAAYSRTKQVSALPPLLMRPHRPKAQ